MMSLLSFWESRPSFIWTSSEVWAILADMNQNENHISFSVEPSNTKFYKNFQASLAEKYVGTEMGR
jgi:CRISPR/Cas system endoribonuclease Cas6 (RAMP superfamily)